MIPRFSKASFKLYQFTGDQLDPEKDTVISSGDAYYSNRGNLSFYCGGKLVVGAKLQLVITTGEEEARSNVVEVQLLLILELLMLHLKFPL